MFALIWIVGILVVTSCTTPKKQVSRPYGSETPEDIEYLDQINGMKAGEEIKWEEI